MIVKEIGVNVHCLSERIEGCEKGFLLRQSVIMDNMFFPHNPEPAVRGITFLINFCDYSIIKTYANVLYEDGCSRVDQVDLV